jgi:hypothetical protein
MGTAPLAAPQTTAEIMVNVFDGTRSPIPKGVETLITIRDGNQKQTSAFHHSPNVLFTVPFFNNFGDDYAVIASAKDFSQAGFFPVHISPQVLQPVDLMLLPTDGTFNFANATWKALGKVRPELRKLLAKGAADANTAQQRYSDLEDENEGKPLACLLNITTALSQIHLPQGTALDYFKLVDFDRIQQDRFFAFVDPELIHQVQLAKQQGTFGTAPFGLHPGATSSFKQLEFGEADVQLTFHENDRKDVDGLSCILVEPDIDYFKDLGAHLILEVAVNAFGSVTEPRDVYVLRWIAGRRAGVPEFDPLYVIE